MGGPHGTRSKVKQRDVVIRHTKFPMKVRKKRENRSTGKARQVLTKGQVCLSMESESISGTLAAKSCQEEGKTQGC